MPRKKATTAAAIEEQKTTEEVAEAKQVTKTKTTSTKAAVKTYNPNEYTTVKSGFHGRLFYKDKTTGETYEWSEFGDEVDMTVGELKRARSAQPRFFTDNWWILNDADLLEFLRAERYYENAFDEQKMEELFSMTAVEIKAATESLSDGQRQSVIFEARSRIASGQLNDLRVVKALEESLQAELMPE